MMKHEDKIRMINWAIEAHRETNHKYDGQDYSVHLTNVANAFLKFKYLVPQEYWDDLEVACYCHDLIEDARKTYNDVLANTNELIAEITYYLTNLRGKNRKERANAAYYRGIRKTRFAILIKKCDRVGNMEYSLSTGSHMFDVYKKELTEFLQNLYHIDYLDIDDYLFELSKAKEKDGE